jgi:carbonic anhydrase/acetyltransferase-like protein (isoleucine patch superfamily)
MIRRYQGIAPQIGHNVFVDELGLVLGDVTLGDDDSVWPFAAVRGDVNRIVIGARSNIQDNAVVHVTHDGPYTPGGVPTLIGDDVTVGHAAVLHACTIGNRVLIDMGAIVLDRVVIEDDVMVAAGSLVSPGKRLKSGWLYRGSPATAARELSADEIANLRYSAEHYVRVKNKHLQST